MGDRAGRQGPPYETACLIFQLADIPHLRWYVDGKLALAGVDPSRVPLATYLDVLYAIVMEAPHTALEKTYDQIVIQAARMNPDRETWGLLPEHQALTQKTLGLRPQ